MPEGLCKLCLEHKTLIQSHLMPRALYDLCRTEDSEPVRVTSEVIMQTSRQTKDYLLCARCDNLLNKEGETWLLPKLATWDKGFPLYSILRQIPPDVVDGDARAYAAARNPEINVHAITHFAMGIFWKASVHPWAQNTKEPRIELGPYGEKMRRFLRNEGEFPENMVLHVGVVPPEIKFINFLDPYQGSATRERNFVFNVPGMQFALTVGKTVSADVRETCFYSNPLHPILDSPVIADDMKKIYLLQSRKAHKSEKLRTLLASKKRS